jgi:hypothetical protein
MERERSPEYRPGGHETGWHPTFEETYPRYEFAELVRLTVAFAGWLVKGRRRMELSRRPDLSPPALSDGTSPAE